MPAVSRCSNSHAVSLTSFAGFGPKTLSSAGSEVVLGGDDSHSDALEREAASQGDVASQVVVVCVGEEATLSA